MSESGKQDEIIFIESPVVNNVNGEAITTWIDESGNSPATPEHVMIITQKGNEVFTAARTKSSILVRVRLRYRSDILTTWRFVWEGQNYQIIELDRTERRKGWLWLTGENMGAT